MIVAITGHRPDKIGGYNVPNPTYNYIRRALDEAFLRLQPNTVIVGMALGVDQLAAELCILNGIPFFAAVPCDNYESNWPPHSQMWYRTLLGRATTQRIVSPGAYASWKMQRRNEFMVDAADRVIAVWNGTPGGTANCVRYAQQMGKPVDRIEFPDPARPVVGTRRTVGAEATPPVIRPAAPALREVAVPVIRLESPRVRPPRSEEPSAGDTAVRERNRAAMEEEERLNAQGALAERRRAERAARQRREEEEQEERLRLGLEEVARRRAAAEVKEEKNDEPQVEVPRFGRILDLDV